MYKESINIIGSGGHTRSVIPLIENKSLSIKGIYDNNFHLSIKEMILGYELLGSLDDIPKTLKLVLAVGDNKLRKIYYSKYQNMIFADNIIHNSSIIERDNKLGKANLIFANTFLNTCVSINDNNIINTGAIIEHECTIGSHNHISINSTLGGRVTIGNECFIGAGTIIKDNISIVDNVIIGAGGVVIKDISTSGTYVGNPVRKIK